MSTARSILVFLVCCFAPMMAQESAPPKVSAQPLSADQIVIYKAFLTDYLAGSKFSLNVATTTSPFEPDKGDLQGCLMGFPQRSHTKETHRLADSLTNDRVHFADPATYKVADVGELMRQGENLDTALGTAFERGLMTLSEIDFDPAHKLAALNYSFQCGRLCGNGGVVIYELKNGHWQRSKRHCGSWIS